MRWPLITLFQCKSKYVINGFMFVCTCSYTDTERLMFKSLTDPGFLDGGFKSIKSGF